MKIFDTFIFFNEIELLKLRLNILYDRVDYFVIVESDKTFSGNDKPYYYEENADMFKEYRHKILYYPTKMPLRFTNQWERERWQRNMIINPLRKFAEPEDMVFISDIDEIPNFNAICPFYFLENTLYICNQDFYYYYLNTKIVDKNNPTWHGSRYTAWKNVKEFGPDSLRDINNTRAMKNIKFIKNGGWHFSYLGGVEQIKYKIKSYSHQEFNNEFILSNIKSNVKQLKDPFFRKNINIVPVKMSYKTHPEYIMDNLDIYKNWIFEI